MDYTREPIIETVITPRDGCKLVVRNSKGAGQEEYFVDAIEVVSFGSSSFFRSIERPKPFLVPVSDYEVLEVREARMVLKNVGLDRSIKIGGGRESPRTVKDPIVEKVELIKEEPLEEIAEETLAPVAEAKGDSKVDRKRERRRHYRRRRGRDDASREDVVSTEFSTSSDIENQIPLPEPKEIENASGLETTLATASSIVSSLLPPPPTLISETIERYKKKGLFKEAFFNREEPSPISAEEASVEASVKEQEVENLEQISEEVHPGTVSAGTLEESLLSTAEEPLRESSQESVDPFVQFMEQDNGEAPPADPTFPENQEIQPSISEEAGETVENAETSENIDEAQGQQSGEQPAREPESQIPNNHVS